MQFSIEPDSGMPIYEQLVRQIKFAVAEGILVPGEVVPSVRELSKSLAVNPNTVSRAFQQLQDEEVLTALRGRGMAVCQRAKQHCVAERKSLLFERLQSVLEEAVRGGLDADSLRDMFEKALKKSLSKQES